MTRFMALATFFLAWSMQAQGGGFASLRGPAQDLAQGEAGGAAAQGADRALVNPGALRLDGQSAWIEAGDQSGLRQQRLGLGSLWSAYSWSLDLGLDSLEGLEWRDAQGAYLGSFGLQAPWVQAALSRDSALGRWGLAAGARDRRWLGGDISPELAGGWSWSGSGPLALGLTAAWRDLALEGQASLAWQAAGGRWGLEGGYIQQGPESRSGLGAKWQLWPGLNLRLGWTRWAQLENHRLSLGLGWQNPSAAMSYAWLPGAGIGSGQKLSVQGRWAAPSQTATPTITLTPSPSLSPTPNFEPSPTPSPTAVPTPVQVELEFVLPK